MPSKSHPRVIMDATSFCKLMEVQLHHFAKKEQNTIKERKSFLEWLLEFHAGAVAKELAAERARNSEK